MTFEVPEHIKELRNRVYEFMTEVVEPAETELAREDDAARKSLAEMAAEAKHRGLWALGHPAELGGGGLPFLDYVYINEVQGRSEYGQRALGTWTLQDSIMLDRHASPRWRAAYLEPLVAGEISPSFAMTEPGIAGSDPTGLQTTAELDGDEWVINGRKWFTTGAAEAAYTTVMCRTESADAGHRAFSMIIVPTDNPGYRIVRDTPALGFEGHHFEVAYENVRVPAENLLGQRGNGFVIAQERLGPGRIFHAMRWLGQAQRAFDLMCRRLIGRSAFGEPLAEKQLMQEHVFESFNEIQAARLLTLKAAERIDAGDQARVEIGSVKVIGARMVHNVIDRAVQVYGAEGLTGDTPLGSMYRAARFARLYDGPDEVHITTVGRRVLDEYRAEGNWEFGLR